MGIGYHQLPYTWNQSMGEVKQRPCTLESSKTWCCSGTTSPRRYWCFPGCGGQHVIPIQWVMLGKFHRLLNCKYQSSHIKHDYCTPCNPENLGVSQSCCWGLDELRCHMAWKLGGDFLNARGREEIWQLTVFSKISHLQIIPTFLPPFWMWHIRETDSKIAILPICIEGYRYS